MRNNSYTPENHYWLKADVVYSTALRGEVPLDNKQYLEWLSAGNMPTPYPKAEDNKTYSREELARVLATYGLQVFPLTMEETQMMFVAAIQKRLDNFAKSRNYDNIMSVATYATSTNPHFAAEGQYAVEARDATWAKCYEILNAALAGQRPIPTWEEVEAELPVLKWPEV